MGPFCGVFALGHGSDLTGRDLTRSWHPVWREENQKLGTRNRNADEERPTSPQRKGDDIADQQGHSHSPFLFLVPSCSWQDACSD